MNRRWRVDDYAEAAARLGRPMAPSDQALPTTSAARRWSSSAASRPRAAREVFGKLEMFNPGGSVKDRIGVAMIEAAEKEKAGSSRAAPPIVEATSGNTGIALGVRVRGQGLRADPHAPAGHEPRARGRCCACTAPRCTSPSRWAG